MRVSRGWIKARSAFCSWLAYTLRDVPRRESRWGVFRSRCGWVSIPNIDVRLFSREPTPYGGAPPVDCRSPSAQYELDFIEGTSIDPTGNWYTFLTRPFPDHSTERAVSDTAVITRIQACEILVSLIAAAILYHAVFEAAAFLAP